MKGSKSFRAATLEGSLVASPTRGDQALLRVVNASKYYQGVAAIENVNFDVYPGEVHAVVGENGAGKSTLCKVISGAVTLDTGEITIAGEALRLERPRDALERGIAMVYQETSLVPNMTVAQNLDLGHEPMLTRFSTINVAAQQLLQSMSFQVEPTAIVSTLGGAQKQMVEIARALHSSAKIILFDEPTASLTPEDIMHLFLVIRRLKKAGLGIIFISHALEESLEIADRTTVMRDGKVVITEYSNRLTRDDLIRHMVGREVTSTSRIDSDPVAGTGRKVLSVENVTMGAAVKNMTFSIYGGEVTGMFGLVGSGRTEIAHVIAGIRKRNRIHGGVIRLNGKEVRYRVAKQAVNDGICYITEDRKVNGFFETMGIADNVYLGRLATKKGFRFLATRSHRRLVTQDVMERLQIRTININAKVIELSGGNQQKVVIAKSLAAEPDLVIFDEPTRGVDVGTIPEIQKLIRTLAESGKAVVVISSYLAEIIAISDRILVTRGGRVTAEFAPRDATPEKIMYAAIF